MIRIFPTNDTYYSTANKTVKQYVYDPAGNILSKTVNGKTTKYKYDDANQLVRSSCDGKTTKYEYDAAGRLVKEGTKSYSYGYLDKELSVYEDGEDIASFTYHMDGQIATAKTKGGTESFLWDGLALISRNETEYVNEPYVTGGNPILANDKVLFNDMLGTTLGVINGDQVTQNNLSAFGESFNALSMQDSFFTGKPHVKEIGYAFLFRNYRPDQGKWLTCDPLGYPDGWNNFAYVNNSAIMHFDFLGGLIGDGIWEWESVGPADDQRTPLSDEFYTGGEKPYRIIRSWVYICSFTIGSAYAAETKTFSASITIGCEGGLSMPGLGISIEETKSKTISETYSTAKGEKAEYSLYQLVETYYFYKNGSVSRTIKN